MKAIIGTCAALLILFVILRLACDGTARSIATNQIVDYCNQHGINPSPPPQPFNHYIEPLRSIFDYTLTDGNTHRVRVYVTIFGRCERHVLVE